MKTKKFAILAIMIGMVISVSAQDVVNEPKFGTDSVACVRNISIYTGDFKQWKEAGYAPDVVRPEMIAAWREVWTNCPRARQSTYTDGEKIIDYLIKTNPNDKDAYIDTICMLMDKRAKYFPTDPKTGASQVAYIMGRKGYYIYTYNNARYEEAYNVLKDAVALDASQLIGADIDVYFKATIDMVKNDKAEKMTVINVYEELSDVVDDKIEALAEAAAAEVSDPIGLTADELIAAWGNPNNVSEYESEGVALKDFTYGTMVVTFKNDHVDSYVDKKNEIGKKYAKATNSIRINKGVKSNLDNLFQPYASCDDLIKVFTAKMAETPDDVNLLKRITTILDKKDCTDSKLFLDASKKLYEIEPSPEAAYNIGVKLFKEGKNGEAATYFEQATSSANNDRVFRAYRNLAYCYLNINSFGKCRDAARRAAAVDPTSGEPYIIIGLAYAASANSMSDMKFGGKEAYWVAVDKFAKARQLDSSVAARANDLIRSYSQHFPDMTTIFFNTYSEGQSYTVGGWINETTTIRAAK